MKTYAEFQPTGFDRAGLGLKDRQDWLVAPCGTNRDADTLTRANWQAQADLLAKYGEGCETHNFGHWACGWFELVLVRPESEAARKVASIEAALADYPVVSDNVLSDLEYREACEWWARMTLKERVETCQETETNVFAARRDEMPANCLSYMIEHLNS